jgi:hypothetical protein
VYLPEPVTRCGEGIFLPSRAAKTVLPTENDPDAMSITIGGFAPAGMATDIGFVPKKGVRPPHGATLGVPLRIATPIKPRSTACKG